VNVHHADEARAARAREGFRQARGVHNEPGRARAIAALPLVEWKGRRLRTLRCHGTSGKGPHDLNVPEALLWALIDLNGWLCPFHVSDRRKADPR